MDAPSRPRVPLRRSSVAIAVLIAAMAVGGGLPMAPPAPVAAVPCDPTRDPDCDVGGGEIGAISVALAGAGSTHAAVTSSPAGISCGSTCYGEFEAGTEVTLTATVDTGWDLAGWTGCTSVSGMTCTVVATAEVTEVFATIEDLTHPLMNFLSPVFEGRYRGSIRFEATASDAGSGVDRVEFFVDFVLVGTDRTAPYVVDWDSRTSGAQGRTSVTARAFDKAGLSSGYSRPVTIDNIAPTGVISSPESGTVVTAPVAVAVSALDRGGTWVASVAFVVARVGGEPWSTTFATDTSAPWQARFDPGVLPADGTYDLSAVMTDAAGNQARSDTVRIVVDRVVPTASTDALRPYHTTRSFPVSWSGSDAGSGITGYDVRYRKATYDAAALGDWTAWLSAVTETSATFTGTPGEEYCFSSRAHDRGGLVSDWSPARCTAVALDDRSMTATPSGAWTRNAATSPDARYLEGTYSRSSKAGAKLARLGIHAKRIAIVVTRCSSCGKVAVVWNGSKLRTVNLANASTVRKQVIEVVTFASMQSGTLTLKQASGGKRVEVDGVLFAKL